MSEFKQLDLDGKQLSVKDETAREDIATLETNLDDLDKSSVKNVATGLTDNCIRVTKNGLAVDVPVKGLEDNLSNLQKNIDAKLNTSLKGTASGLAELDDNGKVPSSQLPSYVDDVIEGYFYNSKFYKESAHTTAITGETGKIYIDLSTNKTYRWSGSAFVVVSETLALGETSSTAYRGDRGKTAYDHSQTAHAPSNAQENVIETVKVNGTALTPSSKTVDIPVPNYTASGNIALNDNNFSLSQNCVFMGDLNDAVFTGYYKGYNMKNAPVSDCWLFGFTISSDVNNVRQVFWKFAGSNIVSMTLNDRYERVRCNGEWGEWTNTSVRKDVPSNAQFTDTTYVSGRGINIDKDEYSQNRINFLDTCIGVSDWNNADRTGFYIGYGAENSPTTGGFYYGIVIAQSTKTVRQIVWQFAIYGATESTFNKYEREKDDGTWKDWISANDADTLDGNHASAFATASHTHDYAGSSSAGGDATRAIAVADYGDATKTIQIGFNGAGATTSNLAYIAGYLSGGTQIKDVSKDTLKSWLGLGSAAYTARSAYATSNHTHNYIDSVGVANPQTGRTQSYGNVYSYNTNASTHEGAPAVYTSVIGFGLGAAGTVEIAGDWVGGHGLYARALRDYEDSWYDWQQIYTSNYHPSADQAEKAKFLSSHDGLDLLAAGSATQPAYFASGVPQACTYTLEKSVPKDAKFTDTTYAKATSSVLGLIKIGYTASGKNYPVALDSEGNAFVNVPWTDTASGDTVSFLQSLTSGTVIGTLNINGTSYTLYAPSDSGVTVDSSLSSTSTNPVQNKVIYSEFDTKMDKENPVGTGSFSMNRKADTTVGAYSHAEGRDNEASGLCSHAEGYDSHASGLYSHAEGGASASGGYSHAEGGVGASASGLCSHAENQAKASGDYSHAEGYITTASGSYSHAEGYITTASGQYSHAEGFVTTSLKNQHAQGHFNNTTTATENSTSGTSTGTAFVIGNGTNSSSSNAVRVTGDGHIYATNASVQTGADYAEYFEWGDGNPDNEDRVGLFVTFDEDNPEKIRIANNEDDYILGIVSGMPSVIGNGDEDWKKRYVLDDFGRYIQETFEYVENEETKIGTKWKENPEYDNTKPYAPRAERAEWSAIGLVGVLSVYDDGTCEVNGYCKCKNNGIATVAEKGADTYRVIKRVTDNIVKVVLK